MAAKPKPKTVAHQPSWILRNDTTELALTCFGGHMAPVTFFRDSAKPVQPYYINPWHGEGRKLPAPVLKPLRGDFFCLPFGGNPEPLNGKQYPIHGETASRTWSLKGICREGKVATLAAQMNLRVGGGKVLKRLSLRDGHNVVYCQHTISGVTARLPLGHHATLALPETEGAMKVSSSKFALGLTNRDFDGLPEDGSYQSLALNGTFNRLDRVPLIWKSPAVGDCSSFPIRAGFTDIMAIFKKTSTTPAWMTAVNTEAGYLWFSMKDAAQLPATLFWISNGGRHGAPWLGRNRCLGLEDVCGNFALGAAASATANPVSRAGFKTAVALSAKAPTQVNTLQGVAKVPRRFGRVKNVKFEKGKVVFVDTAGKQVSARVCYEFITSGCVC
jgi:hypothetical protein